MKKEKKTQKKNVSLSFHFKVTNHIFNVIIKYDYLVVRMHIENGNIIRLIKSSQERSRLNIIFLNIKNNLKD